MQQRSFEGWVELASDLSVRALNREAALLYGLEEQAVLGRSLGDVLWTDTGRIDCERLRAETNARGPDARLMLHRSCSAYGSGFKPVWKNGAMLSASAYGAPAAGKC